MTDFRMETFLEVCLTLSYTAAAERLGLTQPAVSQHLSWLENKYDCKLFTYSGKKLTLTDQGRRLERYALSLRSNEESIVRLMGSKEKPRGLEMGATKTVGEYVVAEKLIRYISAGGSVSLTVDNTENLLQKLDGGGLDFALIEGNFDKSKYFYQRERISELTGICASGHNFAGRQIDFEEFLTERIILREKGSGTRDILEQILSERGLSVSMFNQTMQISNFSVIKKLVRQKLGIAFVYGEVLSENAQGISAFTLKNCSVVREFNYVALKDSVIEDEIKEFIRVAHSSAEEQVNGQSRKKS